MLGADRSCLLKIRKASKEKMKKRGEGKQKEGGTDGRKLAGEDILVGRWRRAVAPEDHC